MITIYLYLSIVYMPIDEPHRSCGDYEEIFDEMSGVLQQYDNTMV